MNYKLYSRTTYLPTDGNPIMLPIGVSYHRLGDGFKVQVTISGWIKRWTTVNPNHLSKILLDGCLALRERIDTGDIPGMYSSPQQRIINLAYKSATNSYILGVRYPDYIKGGSGRAEYYVGTPTTVEQRRSAIEYEARRFQTERYDEYVNWFLVNLNKTIDQLTNLVEASVE